MHCLCLYSRLYLPLFLVGCVPDEFSVGFTGNRNAVK